jgi:hypothetical protein
MRPAFGRRHLADLLQRHFERWRHRQAKTCFDLVATSKFAGIPGLEFVEDSVNRVGFGNPLPLSLFSGFFALALRIFAVRNLSCPFLC